MASKEHAFPWCPNSTLGTSYGIACSRLAISITLSAGTKRNSAFGSTNFLINQGQATLSTFTFSRVIHFITSFLQLLVQSFKAFDSFGQKLPIAHLGPGPAAQNCVDPNALRSLEFLVLQIGVVHHLRHPQHSLVCNPEPLHQRLECAIVSM